MLVSLEIYRSNQQLRGVAERRGRGIELGATVIKEFHGIDKAVACDREAIDANSQGRIGPSAIRCWRVSRSLGEHRARVGGGASKFVERLRIVIERVAQNRVPHRLEEIVDFHRSRRVLGELVHVRDARADVIYADNAQRRQPDENAQHQHGHAVEFAANAPGVRIQKLHGQPRPQDGGPRDLRHRAACSARGSAFPTAASCRLSGKSHAGLPAGSRGVMPPAPSGTRPIKSQSRPSRLRNT